MVLIAVGVTLIAVVVVDRWRTAAPPARPRPTAPAAGNAAATDAPTSSPTTAPAPTAERVWPAEPPQPGEVVTFGGARCAVGEGGDVVETGDWTCTGRPSAVVLRPSTGEVVGFDGWPAPGDDAAARPLARVEGATRLEVSDRDGDGCDDLQAVDGDGRAVPVDTGDLGGPT